MERAVLCAHWTHGWIAALPTVEAVGSPAVLRAASQAAAAGAVGFRTVSLQTLAQLRIRFSLPLIGGVERRCPDAEATLTPTLEEVDALVGCGADVIAVEGTGTLRSGCQSAFAFITQIKEKYPGQPLLAEVSTFDEAMNCAAAGADLVQIRTARRGPVNAETLIGHLSKRCGARVIAATALNDPKGALSAFRAGAFAAIAEGSAVCPPDGWAAFGAALTVRC